MKQEPRTFELNRETVRELEAAQLKDAIGGQATLLTCNYNSICQLTYQPRCF